MRVYTVEEARALLPQVVPVLEELRSAFIELRALQASIEAESRGASGDGNLLADPWNTAKGENRVETLNRTLRQAALRLGQWDIQLKDAERGLIDFHHERNGRVVFLCYELGEPDIRFWHPMEAGYAGRQPLDE
ncbi:MAG: DUF2203 domain-containing protein [Hyphomicrobiales bacterium]